MSGEDKFGVDEEDYRDLIFIDEGNCIFIGEIEDIERGVFGNRKIKKVSENGKNKDRR